MAVTPKRIQLRRTKGWRKPEGAIVVSRPSRFGNPFTHRRSRFGGFVSFNHPPMTAEERAAVVDAYRNWLADPSRTFVLCNSYEYTKPTLEQIRSLRGHDLACWCPLVDEHGNPVPCHADVLLELANKEE